MSGGDLRRFGQDTSPSGHDVRRLQDRLAAARAAEEVVDALLRELPGPADGADARVRARVHRSLRRPRGRPAWALPVAAAAASAALTLIVLRLADRPPALDVALAADAALPAGLALGIEGEGHLVGTATAPRIRWRRGTLRVEVDPAAGLAVAVDTPEAEIAVVGTVFTVRRGPLGTTVAVERGGVAVRCRAEERGRRLDALTEATCPPTTPAGLLARARALQGAGDAAGAAGAAAAGLAMAPGEAVRIELALCRVEALGAAGPRDVALAAASSLVSEGAGHRRTDALRVALGIAGPGAPCSEVRPWLEELLQRDPAVDELGRLADCVAASDPARARALLERALEGAPTAEERARIERRLADLP